MPSLFREPIIHFLILGLVFYLALELLSPNGEAVEGNKPDHTQRAIYISLDQQARIEQAMLANLTERGIYLEADSEQYQYERDKAVEAYIADSLLYRDALDKNLQQDDAQVRARLIEKNKLLAMENASMQPISNDQIAEYYQQNQAEFTQAKTLDVWLLYFSKQTRAGQTLNACKQAQQRLKREADLPLNVVAQWGDRDPQQRQDLRFIKREQLAALFNPSVAQQLFSLTAGDWSGPIVVAQGCYLAKVLNIHPRQRKALEQVKLDIVQSIESQRNQQALQQYLEQIKQAYEVTIER